MTETAASERSADVIVVGAGPAGSTTAYYLAKAGLDVLLLEKTAFPREKVCGDGLTPRATKQLVAMGIDISEEAGWLRNKGLRIIGGGVRLQLDWPDLASFPDYGLVRKREDFDELLAQQAQKAGARLYERCNVGAPIRDERTGRITGVEAKLGEEKTPVTFHAPLVVAADGNSTRLSLQMGLHRREDRPMGVAVRTYFTSPRHDDDYLESWLELWDRRVPGDPRLLPGYGWIFGMGDGTSNVGLGVLNTSASFKELDWREVLKAWCASMPEEWGYTEENMTGPIRGAALPMAFNRQPHYTKGLLLVGDAGGLVNPFNGEGIAYAMESGQIAADVIVQAHARHRGPTGAGAPVVPADPEGHLRGYYTLGRAFVKLIGNPKVMKLATQRGLTHPMLMRFTLKLLANLTDPSGGDAMDRVINGLSKVAPRS